MPKFTFLMCCGFAVAYVVTAFALAVLDARAGREISAGRLFRRPAQPSDEPEVRRVIAFPATGIQENLLAFLVNNRQPTSMLQLVRRFSSYRRGEVGQAIEVLTSLGLIEETPEGNFWIPTKSGVTTHEFLQWERAETLTFGVVIGLIVAFLMIVCILGLNS